jgi:hypothetical protein
LFQLQEDNNTMPEKQTETINLQADRDGVYAPNDSPEQTGAENGLSEQQIQDAAEFDRYFGNSAYEFRKTSEKSGYKFSVTTPAGRYSDRSFDQDITAPTVEDATRQSWDLIQEYDQNGTPIDSARIDWSDGEGPQVSYIYDRQQGFELDRPPGITLQAEKQRLSDRELEQRFADAYQIPVEEVRAALEAQKLEPVGQEEAETLVAQTINEAQENGALTVGTNPETVVAEETNEIVAKPTEKEIKTALEAERQNILTEAQTPHEPGLDGALKSYVNGRADAYNNIRNALAESSAIELPRAIEPEEIAVVPPALALEQQESLQLSIGR